ncbi:MAG TPA: aminopeptidase, partial [Chloroflexia bacterium]|nr:aminopeptidase [Chloroflexia bacterium]
MADPRTATLAQILIHYSVAIQPGQTVAILGTPTAAPLIKELYRSILQAGGHPYALTEIPDLREIALRAATDAQLSHLSPFLDVMIDRCDSIINLIAPENTRALTGVDPARLAFFQAAQTPLSARRIARLGDPRFHDVI